MKNIGHISISRSENTNMLSLLNKLDFQTINFNWIVQCLIYLFIYFQYIAQYSALDVDLVGEISISFVLEELSLTLYFVQ